MAAPMGYAIGACSSRPWLSRKPHSTASSSTRTYSRWPLPTCSTSYRTTPFVDGNKRTGLLAALVFLNVNGISITPGSPGLYELTLGVAEGRVTKITVAETLRQIVQSR